MIDPTDMSSYYVDLLLKRDYEIKVLKEKLTIAMDALEYFCDDDTFNISMLIFG